MMVNLFTAKVRRVGNSLGVIIPKEVLIDNGYREGDEVKVVLPRHDLAERNKAILRIAGKWAGKLGPFEREKEDRF